LICLLFFPELPVKQSLGKSADRVVFYEVNRYNLNMILCKIISFSVLLTEYGKMALRVRCGMYRQFGKRALDVVISLVGIVVLAVPMLILVAAIKLDSHGPVFFKQKRVGIHKTYFEILKFRTMRIDTPKDTPTHLLENPEQWITKVGGFLRKTSLDELPQIINILIGQMSIIGPRPALWNQYDLIEERDQYGANDVMPGLTGWAQINGRDELPIDVKARYDGDYVEKLSFWFDAKCFFLTVWKVLKRDGVVEGAANIEDREMAKK